MPGTLSATVSIVAGAETGAPFAGSGALSSVNAPKLAAAAALAGAGYLDTAAAFALYAQAAGFTGSGALAAASSPRYPIAAALSGTGVLTATATVTAFSDDFNRANSTTTLGTNWVPRDTGVMGITGNTAYPVSVDPTSSGAYQSWISPMQSEDVQVSIVLGPFVGSDPYPDDALAFLGANTAGVGALLYAYNFNAADGHSGAVGIIVMTSWGNGDFVGMVEIPVTTGDKFTLRRIGSTYYIIKNDASYSLLHWTDTTNLIPRDSSHRLVGISGGTNGTTYRTIDSWDARVSGPVPTLGQTPSVGGEGTLSATAAKYTPPPPTIVGSNSAAGTTVTMPTHAPGDLILAYAFRDGSATAPSVPAVGGSVPLWGTVYFQNGTTCSAAYAMAVATLSSHTTGTFTSASAVSIVVLRNAAVPSDAYSGTAGVSATMTYPALSLWTTAGTSRVIRFGAHRTATNLTTNTPAGYTQQSGVATECRVLADTAGGVTANPTAVTQSVNASSGWLTLSLEVLGVSTAPVNDPFTSVVDPALWEKWDIGGGGGVTTATINAGRLSLNCTTNPSSIVDVILQSVTGRTLGDGQSLSFKVVSVAVNGDYHGLMRIYRGGSSPGAYTMYSTVCVYINASTCYAYYIDLGGNLVQVGSAGTHTNNNYYRIRRAGSTIFWETSTNGTSWSAWTNSTTVPAFNLTGLITLDAQYIFATGSSLVDDVVFG